jgi:hypothetical protein
MALAKPTHVFGQQLASVHHASDVARIQILKKYGGIYLGEGRWNMSYQNYGSLFGIANHIN